MGRYSDLVNRFSATPVGRFVGRTVASRIDPLIFRATKGRFTSTGRPTLPMLALTTTGRRSGQRRTVQLAYVPDGEDWLVVASNWGQENHPAWSHNLLADPDASVLVDGEERPVRAEQLSEGQKQAVWPDVERVVPQQKVYPDLTDREFRVFRLHRR
jgi:deazaflavin-dependent oxidoreductase (nitroreductase family)